ncbi:MAG: ATP-grasp domain-containing protein [Gemmatimonadales bacterium]
MKIFVYEHVTGGGMADAQFPPGLLHEGELMLRTLVGELAGCPGVELLCSRDERLPTIPGIETIRVGPGDDWSAAFARGAASADAVWPTAPETDRALELLTVQVERLGKTLLGCRSSAVRIAASKRLTAERLAAAGIPVVPTAAANGVIPAWSGRWVTKPDDGAGAEDTLIAEDSPPALERCRADSRLVVQPWLEGPSISLSMLCVDGESLLLSRNRQRLRISDGRVTLAGLEVNAAIEGVTGLAQLADRIAKAIPGLWGYVGVDLVLTDHGPVVLEVNPRLTTSYCGLGRALGINVAAMVLDLLVPGASGRWRSPAAGSAVELDLEACPAG